MKIRLSSPKIEGVLQVSKWLKTQVLLDQEEMQGLLAALGEIALICVSEPVTADEAIVSTSVFETKYAEYVDALKQGAVPSFQAYRRYFSSAMSSDLTSFYAIKLPQDKYLIKPIKPVIQLQAHQFFYSEQDKKFHPMVLSEESISWGLQFSYPQFFQDVHTRKVGRTSEFNNHALFTKLLKWVRSNTLPTPFKVGGAVTNSPIRVGRKSLAWIANHPQLTLKGISI
jgi:hypothetical protein